MINSELIRLGKSIREWRRRLGLTQEQLAERAELSYKFVGEIERGRSNPSYLVMMKLLRALELRVEVFERPPGDREAFRDEPASREASRVLSKLERTADQRSGQAIQILQNLFEGDSFLD